MNNFFHDADQLLTNLGNILIHLSILVATTILTPVVLYGLAFVETKRVEAGVRLFDNANATIMAIVAIGTIILLLVYRARERTNTTGTVHNIKPSLRLRWRSFLYSIGVPTEGRKHWQPEYITEESSLNRVILFTNLLIIVLGTLGSMQDQIRAIQAAPDVNTWRDALTFLAADSDLLTFTTFIGGLTYTAVLLAGLHFVINLNYQLYTKINYGSHNEPPTDELDTQEAPVIHTGKETLPVNGAGPKSSMQA